MTVVADALKRVEARLAAMEAENQQLAATNLQLRARLEVLMLELKGRVGTLEAQMEVMVHTVPRWPVERTEGGVPEVTPPPSATPLPGDTPPPPTPQKWVTRTNYAGATGKYHLNKDCLGKEKATHLTSITEEELATTHRTVAPCLRCAGDGVPPPRAVV